MKLNIKKVILLAVILAQPIFLLAQDFHFSQYYAAPMTLNPALTGQFNGKLRINAIYRNQWNSIADPYTTPHISIDGMVTDKLGLGAYVLNQTSSNGAYSTLSAGANLAIDLPMGLAKTNHLAIGLGLGIINTSVNFNKLIFEDGLSPNGGAATAESFPNNNKITPDANLGFLYYGGSPYQRVNMFIGATAFHLPQFDQSLSNTSTDPLYRRYLVHAGARIKASEQLDVNITAIGMSQRGAQEIMPSVSVQYYLTNADVYLIGGAGYRLEDALIPYFGFQKGEFSAGLSYDVNTSRLNAATRTYGAWEISLGYIIKPKVAQPKFICPRI